MITEYGMSKKLGPVTFKGEEEEVFLGKEIGSRPHYSDNIASAIDEEVHSIITDSYERARKILSENKKILSDLADELMKKETLSREEILKTLSKVESKKTKRVEQLGAESEDTDNAGRKGKTVKRKVTRSVKKKQ